MTQPREHCGELPPDMGLLRTVPAGECVLHPGHSGSHAAENGMRWTLASAQPASTAAPAPADLREQYAAAIRARLQRAVAPESSPWSGEIGVYGAVTEHDFADAVLAVRDRELEQLRAERDMLRRNFRRALDTAEAANARAASAEAAIARARRVADLIAAGAPWTASRADTARRIREALNPQEQP